MESIHFARLPLYLSFSLRVSVCYTQHSQSYLVLGIVAVNFGCCCFSSVFFFRVLWLASNEMIFRWISRLDTLNKSKADGLSVHSLALHARWYV